MTTLYKLTRQDDTTTGGDTTVTWGANVSHTATGSGTQLCSRDVIHAYTHPLLAVLLNPIHANYKNPKLWRCEGEVVADDHGLKVGVKTLTTIEEISLPVVTLEQRVKFAILCAKQVCKDEKWNRWANKWRGGERGRQCTHKPEQQGKSELSLLHMTCNPDQTHSRKY
jgi:hypothetical protein